MKISLEQVRHVAGLARLTLAPEEELLYQHQLSAILEAAEKLNELQTADVEPTSHASLGESLLREDLVSTANAPAKAGQRFAVPKIIE